MWTNCTHFRHPTEEQLGISDIVRSNIACVAGGIVGAREIKGNLSTRLFCDGDGDRKSLFVPVGVLELSVKSPSFRANARTCILALSLEREYFSFTSSSQSCCNILFWCCYLCRSIFFHAVQILHSNIDKTQTFSFLVALNKRCRRLPPMESQSKLIKLLSLSKTFQQKIFLCTSL